MGSYDLVSFQTEIDADNFAHYLRKECEIPSREPYTFQAADRAVRIGIFPVGVETMLLNRLARRALHSPFVRDVVDSLAGRAMIIGVDRLDYSKGIALYLQITLKSRSEIHEYADMERSVDPPCCFVDLAYD